MQIYDFCPNICVLVTKNGRKSHFSGCNHNFLTVLGSGVSFAVFNRDNQTLQQTMKHITTFGDSIMGGIVLDHTNISTAPRYTLLDNSFVARCASQLGVEIKNHGRFGSTTRHGLREVERWREQVSHSDFVVMEFGGNDCDHTWKQIALDPEGEHRPIISLEDFTKQYCSLIDAIRQLGSQPVLLSLPPIIADRYFTTFTSAMSATERDNVLRWLDHSVENITQWHEMYNLQLFKLSAELAVPIIDITTPFLVERNYRECFCADGIHPNEQGHRLIADAICRVARGCI